MNQGLGEAIYRPWGRREITPSGCCELLVTAEFEPRALLLLQCSEPPPGDVLPAAGVITGPGAAKRIDALASKDLHGRFDHLVNSFEQGKCRRRHPVDRRHADRCAETVVDTFGRRLQSLPAGAKIAGRDSHPLENNALARRTGKLA